VICDDVDPVVADAVTGTDTEPVIFWWFVHRNVYVPAPV
jgi:hypothetical protein